MDPALLQRPETLIVAVCLISASVAILALDAEDLRRVLVFIYIMAAMSVVFLVYVFPQHTTSPPPTTISDPTTTTTTSTAAPVPVVTTPEPEHDKNWSKLYTARVTVAWLKIFFYLVLDIGLIMIIIKLIAPVRYVIDTTRAATRAVTQWVDGVQRRFSEMNKTPSEANTNDARTQNKPEPRGGVV